MKKLLISILILSMISLMVNAEDLSDYPDFFIDGDELDVILVVGNQAPAAHVLTQTNILLSLAGLVADAQGKAMLSSEVEGLDQNIISIGNACVNEVSAQILGNPDECKSQEAKIEFAEDNGNIYLVLNANSNNAINELANQLINYDSVDLEEVVVKDELLIDEEGAKVDKKEKVASEKPVPELFDEPEVLPQAKEISEGIAPEVETSQPILKEESNFITKLIDWFLSLFGKK
jgi:hypothetical protein|tara:strand:+ start:2642 stop:3340 length:699 start_codon:yes stop_codon:yes gene_type:complete